jgi:C-terminal processing protease CtpA/Prc
MNGVVVLTALIAAGSPVPAGPKTPTTGTVDPYQAEHFARLVDNLAIQVREKTIQQDVTENALIAAAIRGLYEEIGQPVPDDALEKVRDAKDSVELVELLTSVRIKLGNHPSLAGTRSLFAAMNGFKHATDPLSVLVSPRLNTYASVDQDFGVGIELEGVTGARWTIYQAEHSIASGRNPPVGYFGLTPTPDAVPCPALFPWRVKRVVPGSPAQQAGVKPGDRIVRISGVELTPDNANKLFSAFAVPRQIIDAQTGRPITPERGIVFQRGDGKPFPVYLKSDAYNPESAFGVIRTAANKWDCMLDRQARIGYIRLGPIESGLDETVAEMMADLMKQGCRALILDLRWCPGGYVDPGMHIAGLFLREGSVITKMRYKDPTSGRNGDVTAPLGSGDYADLPLVVLAGQETVGGGELIAAALRDNDRCVIVGQRTVGRAYIQNTVEAGFGGIQFKMSVGISYRPNGKNRQRLPNSLPTDEWGLRPDEGLEVPITLDKSMELHRDADLQALRPADSTEALPFDDPARDPYRLTALAYLRKQLANKK